MTRFRRAGSRWRFLVHDIAPRGYYGTSHNVYSDQAEVTRAEARDRELYGDRPSWATHTAIPDTEFDELVVGRWLHIEQMSPGTWWMNIAGVTVHVTADREGRPTQFHLAPAGDYADPVPGCTYDYGDES